MRDLNNSWLRYKSNENFAHSQMTDVSGCNFPKADLFTRFSCATYEYFFPFSIMDLFCHFLKSVFCFCFPYMVLMLMRTDFVASQKFIFHFLIAMVAITQLQKGNLPSKSTKKTQKLIIQMLTHPYSFKIFACFTLIPTFSFSIPIDFHCAILVFCKKVNFYEFLLQIGKTVRCLSLFFIFHFQGQKQHSTSH